MLSNDDDIVAHIETATVAMGVLDTGDLQITSANQALATLLGRSMEATVGLSIHEYLDQERAATAVTVVDAMRRGWVDSLDGEVEFTRGDGMKATAYSWSIPLGAAPPYEQLLMGAAPTRSGRPAGFEGATLEPGRVVLGAIDHDWRFSDVSVPAAAQIGWPEPDGQTARLQEIVHPADAPSLLASLSRAAVGKDTTTTWVRVRGTDGEWHAASITLSALCSHPTPRFGVAICLLAGDSGDATVERAVKIEEHLWGIADAVRAGPITAARRDELALAGLTERQRDIVRRLAQGQRVPGIARDLFLSQSTVRNHLGIVYRKLGVHSQSELLERLRTV